MCRSRHVRQRRYRLGTPVKGKRFWERCRTEHCDGWISCLAHGSSGEAHVATFRGPRWDSCSLALRYFAVGIRDAFHDNDHRSELPTLRPSLTGLARTLADGLRQSVGVDLTADGLYWLGVRFEADNVAVAHGAGSGSGRKARKRMVLGPPPFRSARWGRTFSLSRIYLRFQRSNFLPKFSRVWPFLWPLRCARG